jgi:hypothetical protein
MGEFVKFPGIPEVEIPANTTGGSVVIYMDGITVKTKFVDWKYMDRVRNWIDRWMKTVPETGRTIPGREIVDFIEGLKSNLGEKVGRILEDEVLKLNSAVTGDGIGAGS